MAALTAILLTAAALARAEVLLDAKEESLFTLSPSVDVIAFSNYTTNNPLDNLKDFHDTWSPGFDVHEFQVEEGEVRDQLAVETRHHPPTMQVSTTASFSEAAHVVRVTRPQHHPTPPTGMDEFASLFQGATVEWQEEEEGRHEKEEEEGEHSEEFNTDLYSIVTDNDDMEEVEEKETEGDEDAQYRMRLDELQRKYGKDKDATRNVENHGNMKDPLIMLMKIEPHALDLLVRPRVFVEGTMVRLMYERVPRNRPPLLQHLDDPVVEYVPLHWPAQHHRLQNLPMGKYIVCGEAHSQGYVIQANCFETVIDRLDNNMLPGGVVGVICVAIISIFLVIVYAIYYRLTRNQRRQEKEGGPEANSP